MKELWFKKYRPKTIDEYVFADADQKNTINKYIKDRNIPHLIMFGHRGTGKTSLAYLLKKHLEIDDFDFLEFNSSMENSVDVVRHRVANFVTTMPAGDFKIIFFDEADGLTPAAQKALKKIMEDYSHTTRFILTCNNISKLIPEIRDSRCVEMEFRDHDKMDMIERAANVLKQEGVKTTFSVLEKYVDAAYPDFRRLFNLLEDNSENGILKEEFTIKDRLFEVKGEAMLYVDSKDWTAARKLLAENLAEEDYEDMFRFFYENIQMLDKFQDQNKWKAGIVLIAEHLYRNQFMADKEINFCALMIKLSEL